MKSPSLRRAIKLVSLMRVKFWREALRDGCAAAIEHRSVIEHSKFNSLIDVGANVGQFSALVRAMAPHVRIHAFEPLKSCAENYSKVFKNDALTTLHCCALGNQSGSLDIHISGSADSSSLLAISKRQNEIFPGTAEVGVESIEVDRLSSRIDFNSLSSPIFMKIDVQGFELQVLEGCDDVIKRIDTVYVECSFQELYVEQASANDVINYLLDLGFMLNGVYNVVHDDAGQCVQADMLFSRLNM